MTITDHSILKVGTVDPDDYTKDPRYSPLSWARIVARIGVVPSQ